MIDNPTQVPPTDAPAIRPEGAMGGTDAEIDAMQPTVTEFDRGSGQEVTYQTNTDGQYQPIAAGQHPASLPPQPPPGQQQTGQAAPPLPAPIVPPVGDVLADPAPTPQQPAAPAQTQPPAAVPVPKPEESHSAEEYAAALTAMRAENARLQAAVAQQVQPPPAVQIDHADEPDWTDGDVFPTEEAAREAKHAWYAKKYADAYAQQRGAVAKRAEQAAAAAQHQFDTAAAAQTHADVRQRMGLDEAQYAVAMQKFVEVSHPNWNKNFATRNPISHVLTDERGKFLHELRQSGVDSAEYQSTADLHEAQLRDNNFARAVASLPITPQAEALLLAAARTPRIVDVMRHYVSADGRADLQRVLGPGMTQHAIGAEVARISNAVDAAGSIGRRQQVPPPEQAQTAPRFFTGTAGALPAVAPPQQPAPPPPAYTPAALAGMTPNIPVLPTPGRSQPAVTTRQQAPDILTTEGQNAAFEAALAEADRTGSHGWYKA